VGDPRHRLDLRGEHGGPVCFSLCSAAAASRKIEFDMRFQLYQGGPDSTEVKHDPYFNQWQDFDDSPVSFHITEPVNPLEVHPTPLSARLGSVVTVLSPGARYQYKQSFALPP